jgi:hypothetical protein
MVNGGLMAKPNAELFQQAINHLVDCAGLVERLARFDAGL